MTNSFPKIETVSVVPEDIRGYINLGIRVIREAVKDAKKSADGQVGGFRRRSAARWILGYDSKETASLGWYLDHLGACGVSFPPRSVFRILAEDSLAGVVWKRDKNDKEIKIYPARRAKGGPND